DGELDDGTKVGVASTKTKSDDLDWFGTLAYTHQFNSMVSLKVGVDGHARTRDFNLQFEEFDEFFNRTLVDIEERRTDPYVQGTWKLFPGLTIETGLRYEYTTRTMKGLSETAASGSSPELQSINEHITESQLNPSLHMKYALTDKTMLRFSLART